MASIKTAKMIVKASRKANVGVWLWGTHGIGKSELVAQVANELGINFIDIRSALTEAGDWMGLPQEAVNEKGIKYTKFLPSSFLPQDPEWKGIIFLDELNRARPDVLNCVFQLVLNRCIMNHYELPKGASIVVAGNPSDNDYDVTSVDPALLSRFCHVSLNPTCDEWIDFSKSTKVRKDIVGFIESQKELLDAKEANFDLTSIEPSRRGWTMLSSMINALDELGYTDECFLDVATGLVGVQGATVFDRYRREAYFKIDATKILKEYDSIRKIVKQFVQKGKLPEQKQAVKELFDKETFKPSEVLKNEKQLKNMLTFLNDISDDITYTGMEIITESYMEIADKIIELTSEDNKDHELHKVAKKCFESTLKLDEIEQKETKKKKGK